MQSIAQSPTLVSHVSVKGVISDGTNHRLLVCLDDAQFGEQVPEIYREVEVDEATAALALFRGAVRDPRSNFGGSADVLDVVFNISLRVELPHPAELLPVTMFDAAMFEPFDDEDEEFLDEEVWALPA